MLIINDEIKIVECNETIFFISDIAFVNKRYLMYASEPYHLNISFRNGIEKTLCFSSELQRDNEYIFIKNELKSFDIKKLEEINRVIGKLGTRQISI